jgi:hypothetical protein
MAKVDVGGGELAEVPDDWGPQQVQRFMRQIRTQKAEQAQGNATQGFFGRQVQGMENPVSAPQVPYSIDDVRGPPAAVDTSGPLMSLDSQRPSTYDRSETDDWGPWTDKMIKSGARGTALGVGSGLDWAWNVGPDALYRLGQETLGADPKNYAKLGDTPIRDYIERNIIPQPKGSHYENVEQQAETVGPIVLSGGRSILGQGSRALVKTGLVEPAVRTARDVGIGYGGGEVGGFAGEKIDQALGGTGEKGRIIGTGIGGISAPAVVSEGSRQLMRKALIDDRSAPMLKDIQDYNSQLPADAQHIPATIGLVGRKNAGLLEDLLGRGILSGDPAITARRQQYEGLEAGVQDAVARTRSPTSGPMRATEKITAETIGNKASDAAVRGSQIATDRIKGYSDRIRNLIGEETSVDIGDIETKLEEIASSKVRGDNVRAEAAAMLRELRAHHPPQTVTTTSPTGSTLTNPLPNTQQPAYGQVFDIRREIGKEIPGKPTIGEEIGDITYGGLTKSMGETAKKQGMTDWEAHQEQIKQEADDRRAMNKIAGVKGGKKGGTKREKEAFNELFSGSKRGGVEHLDPYQRHVPNDIAEILADKLELELRGETNAGMPVPVPETFPVHNLEQNWSKRSDEYKDVFSQNDATVRGQLDRAARIAQKEETRPGRRTVPGKTGSTIGATQQILNPMVLGGIAHGKIGMALAPIMSATGAHTLGKLLTNPKYVTDLVRNAPPSIANLLSKAVHGAAGAGVVLARDQAAKARAEEEQRKHERDYPPGIQPHQPTDIGTIRPNKKK